MPGAFRNTDHPDDRDAAAFSYEEWRPPSNVEAVVPIAFSRSGGSTEELIAVAYDTPYVPPIEEGADPLPTAPVLGGVSWLLVAGLAVALVVFQK